VQCPRCGTVLQERTRAGVVVDACGRCRGMWLDRGELDKLVAELHAYEQEKTAERAGSSGDLRSRFGRQRTSTWGRLMQLFDPDR
jgi:Zn-finger nucleic acid-binding protein